jgi:hypothetical protein
VVLKHLSQGCRHRIILLGNNDQRLYFNKWEYFQAIEEIRINQSLSIVGCRLWKRRVLPVKQQIPYIEAVDMKSILAAEEAREGYAAYRRFPDIISEIRL